MKTLLAITMLIGAASFTTAHAEWEILEAGSAVSATSNATNASSTTVGPSEQTKVATH